MVRVGEGLRGLRSYDSLEDLEADVLSAVGTVATPGMAFSKPSLTTAGVFGGLGAKGAKPRMQAIAEKALAAGRDPDEVWKYTGWKKGMEGKWRFEIDDSAMKLNESSFKHRPESYDANKMKLDEQWTAWDKKLSEVVDHPELFKQYPELRDVSVQMVVSPKMYPELQGGGFIGGENKILVNSNSFESLKGTLIHEIQHWVQQKEGFARGGSVESFGTLYPEQSAKAYDKYYRLAGEIEARDAAGRRTWDTEMRSAVPPDFRKDAIIRYGNEAAQSVSPLINKVETKFRSAYDAAREVQGGSSFVDIAVLRDKLGLSQEKMAGLLKRAQREGHAVLEKGEQAVVGDYLKGGAVEGNLLVRLDPEFFDNIGSYISGEANRSVDGLVGVDTYEKFNKTVLKDLELNE